MKFVRLFRIAYLVGAILLLMVVMASCNYSHSKVDYPVDFKYASVEVEYTSVADSVKTLIADSISASIARAGLIITPMDSLKGDSLLIVKAEVIQKSWAFGIFLSFYPQGGDKFSKIYLSGEDKNEPIATVNAQSNVPFSYDYNLKKAIEILNNGLLMNGGISYVLGRGATSHSGD